MDRLHDAKRNRLLGIPFTPFTPFLVTPLIALFACNSDATGPNYDPDIPGAWAAAITNPYFPLQPGTSWTYEGETDEGTETIVVEVLQDTKTVMGAESVVVHDRVLLEGDLIEDTYDWYVQDLVGNVWYVGEASEEIEGGQVVGTAGSWEWGVDGALPGIVMWADPSSHIDEEYRQEYYAGEAEDWGKVIRIAKAVTVPFGAFENCIVTEEWNALAPGTLEHKSYCPGIGFVREVMVKGGNDELGLVDLTLP